MHVLYTIGILDYHKVLSIMIHYLQKCDKYVEFSTIPRTSLKVYCFYYEFQHIASQGSSGETLTCEGYAKRFNLQEKS